MRDSSTISWRRVARRPSRDHSYFPPNSKSGHIEEPAFPLEQIAAAHGALGSLPTTSGGPLSPQQRAPTSHRLRLSALVNHSLGRDVTSGYVVMTAERLREPRPEGCRPD